MPTGLIQTLSADIDRLKAQGAALNTLATEAGGYTDEQRAQRDRIVADISRLQGDLAGEQQLQAILLGQPAQAVVDDAAVASAARQAPKPFATLGQQLRAVMQTGKNPAQPDQRLFQINDHALKVDAAATGMSETVGFDGGFAVQHDFIPGLLDRIYAGSQLAQYCDRREIGAGFNGVTYNVVDETSRATGSRGGGVQAYWIAEGGSLTASRPKLAQQSIRLGKLAALLYATDELIADDTALESWTDAEVTDELSFMLDDAIYEGSGSGLPQGIINANALVTVSKETNQAAATINADNVEKMFSRMAARSLSRAAWYINQDCWPQIFQLAHVVGTGGVPMYIPAGGLQDAPFGTLLGRPIRPIEQASTVGTVGDIVFADMSQYLLIGKGGVARAVSMHVQFLTDEMAFRWIVRVNGRSKKLAAVTPFKGSNTTSPFVALQTR